MKKEYITSKCFDDFLAELVYHRDMLCFCVYHFSKGTYEFMDEITVQNVTYSPYPLEKFVKER